MNATECFERFTIDVQLRQATAEDFKIAHNVARYGWRYYLKSARTGKMEGPYILQRDSNLLDFANYLEHGMVWVEFEGESGN